ncbi:Signal transduction histidine kinase [Chitinophaga terrae (ex Kim and Jung 2007)]|uniref:histidine kinase n=1 Tax=Chitinophaga terrae (ex Kim and Jung 2007) TaxID=408074 RepID=A0A1H4GES4_9BACT|nr:HAMP domain-containing sensor histidine kinase [Chitinophaga terrae (ex Kim and Jung 2007)]GEP93366.1 two-component sensor histidine kinase [Chitinophaga terrae (ex Kim and Jung 2007)]SEB08044.1 Signal transduction histidine kinase [Chitinophaga terrae (ex Kim and Jung 2007)]
MKIRTKILLVFAGLTISTILVMTGLVYYFANQHSFEDFYKRLEIRAYLAARATLPNYESDSAIYNEIREEHLEKLPAEKEYFLAVNNNTVSKNEQLSLPDTFYQQVIRESKATYREGDRFYEGVLYKSKQGVYIVIVSAINQYSIEYLAWLRKLLLICAVASSVILIGAGIFFSKYILKPIRQMMVQVKNISSRNLHLRLNVENSEDEITDLATTFNNMLDRLETAFETQNNFVSNASHELGTPLTAIIGEAELALNKERTPAHYVYSLQNILSEAERLEHITRSLLHLAQTGFDGKKQEWEDIRTDELLFNVKRTIDKMYPDNHVEIDYSLFPEEEEKLQISGNMQLLELALTNIVVNAIKYSDNKPVSIALAATEKKNIIIVKDMGIGIPQGDLPYIFSPFFRASNTSKFKGYGIGLPLAMNIVRMHKGDIIVHSEVDHGTEIRVELPL